MKIAVTSVSGQLGSAIAKELIQEIGKENLIGIARTPEKAKHLGIEIRKGDYNSREQFNAALIDVDALLLVSGLDKPDLRIQQHRNVIDAAKQNEVTKIVYTSIVGNENKAGFSPIVSSNRQTEKDIQESGMQYAIGRNGIYIEPDLEYIISYIKEGGITNCAGEGKCGYTSREELANAYAKMLLEDKHNKQIYNLTGEAITQYQLAEGMNKVYKTTLTYKPVSIEAYQKDRKEALGEFFGTIIAGIYEGIRLGANDVNSDFEKVAGRPHKSLIKMIEAFKSHQV